MDGERRNRNNYSGRGSGYGKKRGARYRSSRSNNRDSHSNVGVEPTRIINDPFDSDDDDDEPPRSNQPSYYRSHLQRPITPNVSEINHLSSLLSQTNLNGSSSSIPSLVSHHFSSSTPPFTGRARNTQHLGQRGQHGRGGKQNVRFNRENDRNASSQSIPSLFDEVLNTSSGVRARNSPDLNQRDHSRDRRGRNRGDDRNRGRRDDHNRGRRNDQNSSTLSIPSLFNDDDNTQSVTTKNIQRDHSRDRRNNRGRRNDRTDNRDRRNDQDSSTLSIPSLFNEGRNASSGVKTKNLENVNQKDHFRDRRNNRNIKNDESNENRNPDERKFNRKRKYPLGFKKLEEFLNGSPEDVLMNLTENFDALLLLLEERNLSPDCMCLIIRAVVKIAESYFESHKINILHQVVQDNFTNQLVLFLNPHLHDEKDKRRAKYFYDDPGKFFTDLNVFCETIIKVIPSKGIAVLPKLIKAAAFAIDYLNVSVDVLAKFVKLKDDVEAEVEKFHSKNVKKIEHINQNEAEPPDDFHTIPVYPEAIEITTKMNPFLRENIIDGGYKNVQHYLDVQFRLVRNDFVKPLRDGILAYLDPDKTKRPQNIKVYNGVKFLKSEMCANASNGYLIQLPKPKKGFQMKLENSRLFMFGSLVCFTKNDFVTIIFGRIVDRKIELLKAGQLIVAFNDNTEPIDYDGQYIMVESKVYFEPYYHVLTALQQLDEDDFPMRKFIVDLELDSGVPEYYLQNTIETPGKYRIPIINGVILEHTWPTMDRLKLNVAQYRAYKNALSRKFSIIQGPPGTGKTHLGLVVGKALLHNSQIWHQNQHPMLIICYTNHALDQFLEGLLSTTNEIVRIGGQSKNKSLDQYNIRHIRNKSHNRLIHQHNAELRSSAQSLKKFYDVLDAAREFKGIVNVTPLLDKFPDNVWGKIKKLSKEEFKNWLLGGSVQKERNKLQIDDILTAQNAMEQDKNSGSEENEQNEISDNEDDEEMFEELFNAAQENHNIDDDDILGFDCTRATVYITTLEGYKTSIDELQQQALSLRKLGDAVDPNEWFHLERDYETTKSEYEYLQNGLVTLKNIENQERISENLMLQLNNPDNIEPEDRWKLYFYLVKMYEKQVLKQMKEAEKAYHKAYKEYEDVKMMVDNEMLRTKMVVGMTTTGAARLQSTLKSLRSRIVIVEEAAEIMEAHIITSLTKHCEHLILIGDHQQLRPSTADYVMEKHYNLGISLFERMIRNKVECNVLEIQHRMRPEFAKLIVPTIYPTLLNHESVYLFPPVKGVRKNLYFINHEHEENKENDGSKANVHEVEYLMRLAQYLILNGYKPEDVTILCAYSAQLFKMFAERRKFPLLRDIRICVLDNYQGEESKIILLSLVRNNKENSVGFLKIDNRVCVALSRAREGFYIMGNIGMLSKASPDIWGNIQKTLEQQESVGDALPLTCEIHRNKISYIRTIKDFEKVAEGGCDETCNILLACGHFCKRQCHTTDREHEKSRCRENCTKTLCDDEHPCPKMCYEECGPCMVRVRRNLKCGHIGKFACSDAIMLCKEVITVTLSCGHPAKKVCHIPIEDVVCLEPCEVRVENCGHMCALKCHVNKDPDHLEYKCYRTCDKKRPGCMTDLVEHRCRKFCYQDCEECNIVVKKHRSCGHVHSIKCSESVETMACLRPCKLKLPCGHPCKEKCSDPCGNCPVMVVKNVTECGHNIKIACKDPATKSKCNSNCPLMLPCGHRCQEKCKNPCTTKCNALARSVCALPCGHYADIPCSLNKQDEIKSNSFLLNYCKEPCNVTLKCDHICGGNCGECYQGRIHKVCSSDCDVSLVCGHVCKTPCRAECPPCNQPCQVRCPHTKCGKKCGEGCTPCNEACLRKCIHQECRNKCEEICSVDPCDRPCMKLLKCKHPCIGFCGDPCPPFCRICDKDVVTEIFFGDEDEENVRFVYLEDCKHIVESQGMDTWMNGENKGEIISKVCPKCKAPVINTRRYSDYVKKSLRDVMDVKKKFYGNLGENIRTGKEEIMKLNELCRNRSIVKVCPLVTDIQSIFESQLKPTRQGKRQMLTKLTVNATIAKIQILDNISNLYDIFDKSSVGRLDTKAKAQSKCVGYINFLLHRLKSDPQRMTEQETVDFELELKRLQRIVQFESISIRLPTFRRQSKEYINLDSKIYSLGRYKDEDDAPIKRELQLLNKFVGSLDVTDAELKQIIKVIGVKSGGWYKCPNGHVYAIGECGGAMQLGRCPDCGAAIGGGNHQLTAGNTHANIDGSSYAAWSEQANMANYRLYFDD